MPRYATSVIALLTAMQLAVAAPPKKKQTRRASPAPITVGAPFDASVAALPPHFQGNDFVALYRQLSIDPKSEFETTDDFMRRVNGVPTAVYAFRVPKVDFTYNADEKMFTAKFYADFVHAGWTLKVDQSLLLLHESDVETGRYVGSNAFGVSAVVKRVTNRKWGALLPTRGFGSIELAVQADPDQAPTLKNRLAVLAICRVGPQSIPARMTDEGFADMRDATGFDISGATIDAPTDLEIYYYAILADLQGFWVFDKQSGTVLDKFRPDGSVAQDERARAPSAPPVSPAEELLARLNLSIGMNEDQVRQVLGEPDEHYEVQPSESHAERWVYRNLRVSLEFTLPGGTLKQVEPLR